MPAQAATHTALLPTHTPSWEEKVTVEIDAQTAGDEGVKFSSKTQQVFTGWVESSGKLRGIALHFEQIPILWHGYIRHMNQMFIIVILFPTIFCFSYPLLDIVVKKTYANPLPCWHPCCSTASISPSRFKKERGNLLSHLSPSSTLPLLLSFLGPGRGKDWWVGLGGKQS